MPERKWNDVFVEIYKNGKLMRSVKVGEDKTKASQFSVSPDGAYVAFAVGTAGGTCVYSEKPYAIDLESFKVLDFSENEALLKNSEYAATTIENIEWFGDTESNHKIRASVRLGMKFGDAWDCASSRALRGQIRTQTFTFIP